MGKVVCQLAELEPELLKLDSDGGGWRTDATWGQADGLWFLCPKCWLANGRSAIGTHMVLCRAPHVPQTITPRPGRWAMEGAGLDDVTLVVGSSSVKIEGGCNAHFFIRRGRIEDMVGYT